MYLACKLCPDSSPEAEPVGASTLFVIIAVIRQVVRIFLLHWVDLDFIFLKARFCFQGSANLWPGKLGAMTVMEAREGRPTWAMSLGASLPPQPAPEQGGPDGRRKSGQGADQTQTEPAPGRPPFPQSCLCPGGPRGLRTLRGGERWQWGQAGFPGRGTRGALGVLWDSHGNVLPSHPGWQLGLWIPQGQG